MIIHQVQAVNGVLEVLPFRIFRIIIDKVRHLVGHRQQNLGPERLKNLKIYEKLFNCVPTQGVRYLFIVLNLVRQDNEQSLDSTKILSHPASVGSASLALTKICYRPKCATLRVFALH